MFMEYLFWDKYGYDTIHIILFVSEYGGPSRPWMNAIDEIHWTRRSQDKDGQSNSFWGRKQSIVGNYCCNVNLGTF